MLDICNYFSFQSAIHLAEKYNVGNILDHEIKIASFAATIFDKTEHIHKFTRFHRNILCCSALIHDIGCFVNKSKHHKHTRYLVLADSGLSSVPDLLRSYLSIISSSHRKNMDKSIKFYNEDVQRELKTLIAILRVADALDHTHKLDNTLNSIYIQGENLIFHINSNDFQKTLVRFNIKNQLFNEMFKINARLEPEK